MKYDKAIELVAALRSGKYKQCRYALHTDEGFCCLGVACDITGVAWTKDGEYYGVGETQRYLEITVLPNEIQELFGFQERTGTLLTDDNDPLYTDENGRSYSSLSDMNDHGISFSIIADVIEKHWEQL